MLKGLESSVQWPLETGDEGLERGGEERGGEGMKLKLSSNWDMSIKE